MIVSGFLTISPASVQKVHATLGVRGAPGRAGRGIVLSPSAARMGSGSGSFGAGGCGRAAMRRDVRASVRSAGSRTSARACAFCAERALPSGIFGPRDLALFFRLASARALLTESPRAAPALDMAGWFVGRGWMTGAAALSVAGIRSLTYARNIVHGCRRALNYRGVGSLAASLDFSVRPEIRHLVPRSANRFPRLKGSRVCSTTRGFL